MKKWLCFVLVVLLLAGLVQALSVRNHWYVKRLSHNLVEIRETPETQPTVLKPAVRTFKFKTPTSMLVKESEKKKVDDTPLAPQIRTNRPVRRTLHYTSRACRQSGSMLYFTAGGKSCTFTTPDQKQNQLSCVETDTLQCIGFYCPIDACNVIGLFPPPEDRSIYENKTRPIRPIG